MPPGVATATDSGEQQGSPMGCPGHVINNGSPGVNPFRHGGTRGTGNNGRKSGPNLHERAGDAHTLPGQGPVQWHPGPGSNIPGGGSLSPNHWGPMVARTGVALRAMLGPLSLRPGLFRNPLQVHLLTQAFSLIR
jgi:hypothetical protein